MLAGEWRKRLVRGAKVIWKLRKCMAPSAFRFPERVPNEPAVAPREPLLWPPLVDVLGKDINGHVAH